MESLEDGIAAATEAGRKARVLRLGSDLTIVFMRSTAPNLDITLKMAALAGNEKEDTDEMLNVIMSTALGIVANVMNYTADVLEEFHPLLKKQFFTVLPKVLDEVVSGGAGDVKIMNSTGDIVDRDLAVELEEMMKASYPIRGGKGK